MTRTVADAAHFVGVLARTEFSLQAPDALRVGVCLTPHAAQATPQALQALQHAAEWLARSGARLTDLALPAALEGLTQAQIDIMGHEALAAFAPERRSHAALFSPDGAERVAASLHFPVGDPAGPAELARLLLDQASPNIRQHFEG